jgi:hypothetical protein
MKKVVLTALLAALACPVFASDDATKEKEYMDECKNYAKEDGIAADEMEEYLANCLKDLQEAAAAEDKKD